MLRAGHRFPKDIIAFSKEKLATICHVSCTEI